MLRLRIFCIQKRSISISLFLIAWLMWTTWSGLKRENISAPVSNITLNSSILLDDIVTHEAGDCSYDNDDAIVESFQTEAIIMLQKMFLKNSNDDKSRKYFVLEMWNFSTRYICGLLQRICDELQMLVSINMSPMLATITYHIFNKCIELVYDFFYRMQTNVVELFQRLYPSGTKGTSFLCSSLLGIYLRITMIGHHLRVLKQKFLNKAALLNIMSAFGGFFANEFIYVLKRITTIYIDKLGQNIQEKISADFYLHSILIHLIYAIAAQCCEIATQIEENVFAQLRRYMIGNWKKFRIRQMLSCSFYTQRTQHSAWRLYFLKNLRGTLTALAFFFVTQISRYTRSNISRLGDDAFEDYIANPLQEQFSYDSLIYKFIMHFLRKFQEMADDLIWLIESALSRFVKDLMIRKIELAHATQNAVDDIVDDASFLIPLKKLSVVAVVCHFIGQTIVVLTNFWRQFISQIGESIQDTIVAVIPRTSICYKFWMYFFNRYTEKSHELLEDTIYDIKDMTSRH